MNSHIGEYIKQKLKEQGRQGSWLAEKLGFSRQNIYPSVFEKSMIPIERIMEMEQILGEDFFEDFYKRNPDLQPSVRPVKEEKGLESALKEVSSSSGFYLSLQIDPENFDPDKTPILSKHLEKMLKDYQEDLKKHNL